MSEAQCNDTVHPSIQDWPLDPRTWLSRRRRFAQPSRLPKISISRVNWSIKARQRQSSPVSAPITIAKSQARYHQPSSILQYTRDVGSVSRQIFINITSHRLYTAKRAFPGSFGVTSDKRLEKDRSHVCQGRPGIGVVTSPTSRRLLESYRPNRCRWGALATQNRADDPVTDGPDLGTRVADVC